MCSSDADLDEAISNAAQPKSRGDRFGELISYIQWNSKFSLGLTQTNPGAQRWTGALPVQCKLIGSNVEFIRRAPDGALSLVRGHAFLHGIHGLIDEVIGVLQFETPELRPPAGATRRSTSSPGSSGN